MSTSTVEAGLWSRPTVEPCKAVTEAINQGFRVQCVSLLFVPQTWSRNLLLIACEPFAGSQWSQLESGYPEKVLQFRI